MTMWSFWRDDWSVRLTMFTINVWMCGIRLCHFSPSGVVEEYRIDSNYIYWLASLNLWHPAINLSKMFILFSNIFFDRHSVQGRGKCWAIKEAEINKNKHIGMYHAWDYVWELNTYQKYFSPFYVSFSVKISFLLSIRIEREKEVFKHAIDWHFKIHIINLTTSTLLSCSTVPFMMSCTIWRQLNKMPWRK